MAAQDVPNPLIHKVELKPGGAAATKSRLDQIMEEKEETAARRYSAATLETMALEAENEARRLRGDPPKNNGGNGMDDPEQGAEKKVKVMNSAKALIDAGMDPADVGRMLLNMPPAVNTRQVDAQPTQGGNYVKDVVSIVDLVVGKREDADIKALLVNMNKRLESIESGKTKLRRRDDDDDDGDGRSRRYDPISQMKQQAEAVKMWQETLEGMGLSQKPGSAASESIEMVKEKNRHEEQLLAVKSHAEYEAKLGETVASIPEKVGQGIGRLFLDGDDEEEPAAKGSNAPLMQHVKCECGQSITVPPGIKQFTCPKCGSKYEAKDEPEKK